MFDGKFTYYKGNKKSQNDIVLGNRKALDNTETFIIHEISFNPSDHFPIIATCKFSLRVDDFMCAAAADLLTDAAISHLKRTRKISSQEVDWCIYKEIAHREIELLRDSIAEVDNAPTQNGLDSCIHKLSSALYKTAKTCTNERKRNCDNISDDNMELPFRHLLDKSDEALSRFVSGTAGAEEWHAAKAVVLNENKKHHFGKIRNKWSKAMGSNDAKEIWNAINWKGETDGITSLQTQTPSSTDLASHFLTKGDAHEPIDKNHRDC